MRNWFLILNLFLTPLIARAVIIERVSAIVNDQPILLSEIEKFSDKLKKGGMVDELLVSDPKELLSNHDKLVKSMIDQRIIESEVKRQNLEVTIERVEQEVRSITSRNKINRAQLKQALKEQGVTFAEYQDFTKKRLEQQGLIEKVITSKIKISDEDVASYYLSVKKSSGKEVYEYSLSHILFLPKQGDVDGAKTRAEAVVAKLKEGANFDTLASQYSEDPNFTPGGTLGVFKTGEATPELEAAAKNLAVGSTSGIVRTKIGFHIIKLNSKKLIADPELEAQKEKLRDVLYQQAFKKQFSFWLDQKRQEAFIRIN